MFHYSDCGGDFEDAAVARTYSAVIDWLLFIIYVAGTGRAEFRL